MGLLKNDVYADFMWKTGEVYDIQKSEDENLSRTLSSIEQDKATSDDYVKCILADPQIAAYIVQALVPEFKEMEAEKIIPCIGEPTVMLRFPERLGV